MTDITPIAEALIILLSAVIAVLLIPLIRSRTTASQFDKFLTWVRIGVSAAEQIYQGIKRGSEKKAYVQKLLNDRGYTYDEDTVNAALEAAVNDLKQGK